jgi:histidyl-tRNA synthetase
MSGEVKEVKGVRAVKGTKDILPDEVHAWQKIEATAHELFDTYGYREIRTPIFEPTELFARGIGTETDIVSKEMYTFEDRADKDGKSDSLTLRPEATAGIVRAVLEHNLFQADPLLKVYTLGPMFRAENVQKGRQRQFHQVDVEAFGLTQPAIDVEMIELALVYLKRCGLQLFELVLNSVGDAKCRPAYVEALRAALRDQAAALCGDCQRRAERNPLRVLDCKVPADQEVIDELPKIADHLCAECRDHFDEVRRQLGLLEIPYRLSHRLVRGLDYYTRTTFEVTSDQLGAQNSLLGGGRYDGLLKELGGPDIPGIGFAVGMERLVMALPADEALTRCEVFLAPLAPEALDDVLRAQHALRTEGIRALMDPEGRSLKSQMKKADKLGARFVVLRGDDERQRGVFAVRSMGTSEQEDVPGDQLIPYLKEMMHG